jgi:excisionase family DNA binding protein
MKTPPIAQLRNGPPSVDLQTAAAVLGLGRTKAYEMARHGEFPVRVLRIGGSYRVPTAALLELLGISENSPVLAEARAGVPAITRPH